MQENSFENVISKMVAIVSQPQYINEEDMRFSFFFFRYVIYHKYIAEGWTDARYNLTGTWKNHFPILQGQMHHDWDKTFEFRNASIKLSTQLSVCISFKIKPLYWL